MYDLSVAETSHNVVQFIFILFVIGSSGIAQADPPCTPVNNPVADLSRMSFGMLKKIERERLETNAFAFCNEEMAKRYLLTKDFSEEKLQQLSQAELFKAAEQSALDDHLSGWPAALIPTANMKDLALRQSFLAPGRSGFSPTPSIETMRQQMLSTFKADACTLPAHTWEMGNGYDLYNLNAVAPYKEDSFFSNTKETVGATALCSELVALYRTTACSGALGTMIDEMQTRGGEGQITMPNLYRGVIGSGAYDKGLQIAAVKLLDRYQSGPRIPGNLFDDLKASFVQAGSTPANAETMTWNTLGLIATGGANFHTRLQKLNFPGDRWPTVTALSLISGILPALDHKYGSGGDIYSLPKGVSGRCDTSKNYHFWMAAFLAREARSNGSGAEVAVAAAYSAEKGYANVGTIGGRRSGAILTHGPFTPASQIMRADLSAALAGAVFGAQMDPLVISPINVDKGLSTLIGASTYQEPLSDDAASAVSYGNYSRWSKTFAPNDLYVETMDRVSFASEVPKPNPIADSRPACSNTKE